MYGMGTILLFGKIQSPRTCVRPLPDGAVLLQTVGGGACSRRVSAFPGGGEAYGTQSVSRRFPDGKASCDGCGLAGSRRSIPPKALAK